LQCLFFPLCSAVCISPPALHCIYTPVVTQCICITL
jgi:hypothetical protein